MAFSGGPDSAALAAALAWPAAERGLALLLVHVDHRLDSGSAARAELARALAAELALPFELVEVDVPSERRRGESPESAARRLRYATLQERLSTLGATRILTAHHRDDQVETIVLQLLRGAPLEGVGGMPRRRGCIVRPLLDLPRAELSRFLTETGLGPVDDPTNLDLRTPRNRVRHRLLPRLRSADPGIDQSLLRLAMHSAALQMQMGILFRDNYEKAFIEGKDETRRATDNAPVPSAGASTRSRNEEAFIEGKDETRPGAGGAAPVRSSGASTRPRNEGAFNEGKGETTENGDERDLALARGGRPRPLSLPGPAGSVDSLGDLPVSFLTDLPEPLQLPALRWLLLERLGTDRLSSFPSMKGFLSLLLSKPDARAELRLPGGGRLVARGGRLAWRARESRTPPFSYTLAMPGEIELVELGLRLRIRRAPVEPWMFRGDRWRVGFESDADRATVRSRRPGDRMRTLGSPGGRKLKAILIDRRIPAGARDRLPLLEIEGELAWVPGVALGERFALRGGDEGWLAELEALAGGAPPVSPGERTAR